MTYVVVTTTFGNIKDAKRIGKSIINKELGACFQIVGPIESIYSWNDEVEVSEEYLCFIKTKEDLYEEIEELLIEVHPYDTPEIIVTEIKDGSEEYLDWIDHVT